VTDFTDDQLVIRCRDHQDQDALGQLVHRYQDRVFRLVVSILGQEFAPDAEDVAQEVFVRIHHALTTCGATRPLAPGCIASRSTTR